MGTLGCINDMMRRDKEEAETHQLFKIKLIMLGIVLISGALVWIGITFFF